MQAQNRFAGVVVLTAPTLFSAGCEDSDVTAPTGSIISMQAAPQAINIDQDAGQTQGQSTIIAQVTDGQGLALEDIVIFFTSDGGLLSTVNNVCGLDHNCTHVNDPSACLTDEDCAYLPPVPLKTNANGVATDRLTLRLIEDPDTVQVTGQFTNTVARVQVTKTVNLGPVDPRAVIRTVPEDGQRTGFPFSFDGSESTFDPQVEITCFDWAVVSSEGEFELLRGPDLSVITRTIDADEPDQDLTVTLRVSDLSDIDCRDGVDPILLGFSVFSDTVTYKIRCDLTDPFLANIGTQTLSLLSDGRQECEPSGTCKEFPSVQCTPEDFETVCPRFINLALTATASDPEDSTLFYSWDCGNGTTISGFDSSVTCVYKDNVTVTRTGSVTVQNDCGRTSSDSFTIQINAN